MDDCNIFEVLGQVSSGEAGSIFRNFLRGSVRHLISEVMTEEVTALCSPRHHPIEGDYARAGSSTGRVLIDGQREEVIRPRVRQQDDSGVSSEVPLETYQAANDTGELSASIIQALTSGISTREMKNVKPGSHGVSKSNVSRLWQQAGVKSKLSKKHWGELARLFKRLREVQGKDAAEEVVGWRSHYWKSRRASGEYLATKTCRN